jgi:hypothetical protein
MLAVPLQEMRMWTIRYPLRCERVPCLIDDRPHSILVVCLARDQYLEVVGQADQTTIERPMSRTGQCDPIAHGVWPIGLNRPHVRRGYFCAHSVDELQLCNGAAFIIRAQYNPTKYAIA